MAERGRINADGRKVSFGVSAGAGPRITWALVPDQPNELTPAHFCRPLAIGQGVIFRGNATRTRERSICALICPRFAWGGMQPWRRLSTTLINDRMPAAASQCPTLPFT